MFVAPSFDAGVIARDRIIATTLSWRKNAL
jgi:hypothetical protein